MTPRRFPTGAVPPRSTAARTLVYVHGIGNKPAPAVLKCQWDRALFGFDLGERSRLAYWVDRQRHPEPIAATCQAPDTLPPEDRLIASAEMRTSSARRTIDGGIDQLTRSARRRAVLSRIAREIERRARSADRAGHARVAEANPLPERARQWITRRLVRAFLQDVRDYLFAPLRRSAMREALRERLRPGGGPFVVVAHSQGSLIAYDVLAGLDPDECDVALFVTLGSPLGLTEVQDQVKVITRQRHLAVPACVRQWINVADPVDPVAADKRLAAEFGANGATIVEDHLAWNPDGPRHPHSGTGYLQTRPVQGAVHAAVETALFQPVARFVIARDLSRDLENRLAEARHKVLVELAEPRNDGGTRIDELRARVVSDIRAIGRTTPAEALRIDALERFVAAALTREEIEALASCVVRPDSGVKRIWRNGRKHALLDVSVNTVQARPAHASYQAAGQGISWAILDSGIRSDHPHFTRYGNVATALDCTAGGKPDARRGASDRHGHGTHVAGIVAGLHEVRTTAGTRTFSGVAPQATLHVYKVLDDRGAGEDAWIIKALDHIAETNAKADRLVIHGVNLSLGGPFDQSAYGCGHSPLCVELRRLWRQGVIVVIAAGNDGFAVLQTENGTLDANLDLSIGDPANLEEAIAVGAVHKEHPHTYGISYFSSRGPTADGRQKPDLVAPGERIQSCRHLFPADAPSADDLYVERSGTSMAAPHVSGILAAFLSVRREFVGYPDRVKRILLDNCTDLRRDPAQQGAGLPNLIKMLVST